MNYPPPSSSGRQSDDDQLVRSAPLSLSSPRPFAEGVVAPSKTSTPKKRQEAARDLQRTARDVYRRASFLEEKSAGSRAPLRRQNGMSVKEEEELQEEGGGGVTAAQRHLPNKEKGFHLSLPEIAIGDEEVEEGSNINRHHHDHHRHRHHHHHHNRHRRCRTETERKVSSESSCSGMDSGAGSTSSMFQRFSQLKKRADNGGQQGNLQRSQTTTACDSGLGTPSSQSILKPASTAATVASTAARPAEGEDGDGEQEVQVIRFVREEEVSGGGGTRDRGSKWKSSVTGK